MYPLLAGVLATKGTFVGTSCAQAAKKGNETCSLLWGQCGGAPRALLLNSAQLHAQQHALNHRRFAGSLSLLRSMRPSRREKLAGHLQEGDRQIRRVPRAFLLRERREVCVQGPVLQVRPGTRRRQPPNARIQGADRQAQLSALPARMPSGLRSS